MEFELKYFIKNKLFWFTLLYNQEPYKIDENFPLWFCIDNELNLVYASNDPNDENQFVVNYFKKSNIKYIIVSENIFYILNPDIKSVYSRSKPSKMILWSKRGHVKSIFHDNFYYEYNNDGSIYKIVNSITGDSKFYTRNSKVIAEIFGPIILSITYNSNFNIVKDKYIDISDDEYLRLKNIEVWQPFPIYNLRKNNIEKDRIDNIDYFYIILDNNNLIFKFRIINNELKLILETF